MSSSTRHAAGVIGLGFQPRGRDLALPALLALVALAWAVVLVGQATGNAALLHQHESPAAGVSLWLALASFMASWQVMVAATMLPATLPAMRAAAVASRRVAPPALGTAAFLIGFLAVWTAFGSLTFIAAQTLERLIAATPWLAVRPWLVQASVVALAGVYQLTPLKRRSLAACRHPARLSGHGAAQASAIIGIGLRHGLACLASSWALMAVMVVAGLRDLWWMAALTAVMVYEAAGRHGQRMAGVAGVLLLWLAALILLPAWLPA
jgi:predicted metal-binding membrane protein